MHNHEIQINTPEYVSLRFQPANIGSRAVAVLIDTLIITITLIVFFLLGFLVIDGMEGIFHIGQSEFFILALIIIIFFAISYGYYIFFEYFTSGQTPGKKVAGIRVIQENGHSITLLASILRNLMRIIDYLPSFYFLGILMIYFHSKNKRLGDLVAGTVVVHEHASRRRLSKFEKEVRRRNLPNLDLEKAILSSLGEDEWRLVKAYSERIFQLNNEERIRLTESLTEALFPKLNIDSEEKSVSEKEDILLSLYILLREDWDLKL